MRAALHQCCIWSAQLCKSLVFHKFIFPRKKSLHCFIKGNLDKFVRIKQICFVSGEVMPFHVSCQIACCRGCKVTIIAFAWLFSTVRFQMSLQVACPRGCKFTLTAFLWFFFHYGFSYVTSHCLPEKMHIHIGCISLTFLHSLILFSLLDLFHWPCFVVQYFDPSPASKIVLFLVQVLLWTEDK